MDINNRSEREVVCIENKDNNFFSCDSNSPLLEIGKTYNVVNVDVHSYHAQIELKEFPNIVFNSVCFEEKEVQKGKDIGFCSITEDLCRKEGECEKCSLKHIHENMEHYAKLHEQGRLIEQKHGRWIYKDDFIGKYLMCSECSCVTSRKSNYCPNCGAKMELKKLEGDKE